ncbi:hypothetical protein QCA50_015047 [Cerrena zonata]|uniref:P-loop containing nucleoside triphosphate hydrolase protein n=1 Tax=Cerrena zonata TaxID=2478898 RepID=A0AAW0FY59_9APHY
MLDSGQAILPDVSLTGGNASVWNVTSWRNIQMIPAYVSALSLVIFLAQMLNVTFQFQKQLLTSSENTSTSLLKRCRLHVEELGLRLFLFRLGRFATCTALVVLSLISPTPNASVRIWLLLVYIYSCLLALLSVVTKLPRSRVATRHLNIVLLVPLVVYGYRDVWPLVTYDLSPADGVEGKTLWIKIACMAFAAIFLPLFAPRQYIPVDPEDTSEPTLEQTVSWLSLIFYTYCDVLIMKAFRTPHLNLNELPPLSDFHRAKYLSLKTSKYLDPLHTRSKMHIGLKLILQVFPFEHLIMVVMVLSYGAIQMGAPIGINRLLNYLETGGKDAEIRPWFWVTWIFASNVLTSLSINYYNYQATMVFTECQAIMTQLIFEHALRMRVKAEVGDEKPPAETSGTGSSTVVVTPDNASASEQEEGAMSTPTTDNVTTDSTTKPKANKPEADEEKKADKKRNLVGKLNNLVTSDLDSLNGGQMFVMLLFSVPSQLGFSLWFLYSILGWAVFPGFAAMVVLSPLPGLILKTIRDAQVAKMKKSDARVQIVTETLNMIRMIKLFGWEGTMAKQINEKRAEELVYVRRLEFLEVANDVINSIIPVSAIIPTFAAYTLLMKQPLTASKVFSSIAAFGFLQRNLHFLSEAVPPIIQAKVGLDRMNEFLQETELLDQYTLEKSVSHQPVLEYSEVGANEIGIRQTSSTWANEETDGDVAPSRRRFALRIDDEVFFKKGCINLVIGQTGAGKTSLLMALLGEMHSIPSGPDSLVSLPRQGGIAYHAQESWVLNETIRDNILFGSSYDEKRYNAVIEQCALKTDLELFSAGDETEVGEKGITLSGGQKARVTLARAVYSTAEILLLDDVLAALDVHTARWVVEKCLQGDLVRGRTVILVTHNVAIAAPIAEFVVSIGSDGKIASQGSLSNVLAKDKKLFAEVEKENKALEEAEYDPLETEASLDTDTKNAVQSGRLIVEEEVEIGHLSWGAMKLLVTNMGGKGGTLLFWTQYFVFGGGRRISQIVETWVLALWSGSYESPDDSNVPVVAYLSLYTAVSCLTIILDTLVTLVFVFGTIRAARRIHKLLINSVLGSTLRWLDRTPVSRIIARSTQDIQQTDSGVPAVLDLFLSHTLSIISKFLAVIVVSPFSISPGVVMIIAGVALGNIYIKAGLPLKREGSNAKAPVLGHFSAAISGLVSIRAYGAQESFRKESYRRIDTYSRVQRPFWDLNRWISVRMNALSSIFAACLATYLTYTKSSTASKAGFILTTAVSFSGVILAWVRFLNTLETRGNSLERIKQYLDIEHEPRPTKDGVPPAYWPASGSLNVEKLSARYSNDGPKVLHDISFTVQSGERIGIVGRTGSGKSSLTLALLRAIITEGTVYYDGIATNTLNLDALRSKITIIPQVPELLSGTIRHNLDPLSEHDDAVLNDALRSAGLFSLQSENAEHRLTLDTSISGGGGNLSVGQRQILALARALVRQSKILILDEATSAIDYETDSVIQNSLRSELGKDVTLLTVAHRLQTVMDSDKIMVLDAGRIVEFDKPGELLKNQKSYFRALVDESGDRDTLVNMIKE